MLIKWQPPENAEPIKATLEIFKKDNFIFDYAFRDGGVEIWFKNKTLSTYFSWSEACALLLGMEWVDYNFKQTIKKLAKDKLLKELKIRSHLN